MVSTKAIVIAVVVVIVIVVVIVLVTKKKKTPPAPPPMNGNGTTEGYSEVMIAPNYDDFTISRPTFKADLSPRFDPYRIGGGYIKSKYPPAGMQAAGVTPLSDSEEGSVERGSVEGFMDAKPRGKVVREGFAADGPTPGSLGLPSEVDSATGTPIMEPYAGLDYRSMGLDEDEDISYKDSCRAMRNGGNIVKFRSAQGYADPDQLLPTPDIRSCLKDPSDPLNYMYDRTIFAPLKRRNAGNYADYIRGDLPIEPIRGSWFSVATIPSVDLVKGAMSILNGPSIDDQDTIYQRARPLMSPQQEEQMDIDRETLPFGDLPYHLA